MLEVKGDNQVTGSNGATGLQADRTNIVEVVTLTVIEDIVVSDIDTTLLDTLKAQDIGLAQGYGFCRSF